MHLQRCMSAIFGSYVVPQASDHCRINKINVKEKQYRQNGFVLLYFLRTAISCILITITSRFGNQNFSNVKSSSAPQYVSNFIHLISLLVVRASVLRHFSAYRPSDIKSPNLHRSATLSLSVLKPVNRKSTNTSLQTKFEYELTKQVLPGSSARLNIRLESKRRQIP